MGFGFLGGLGGIISPLIPPLAPPPPPPPLAAAPAPAPAPSPVPTSAPGPTSAAAPSSAASVETAPVVPQTRSKASASSSPLARFVADRPTAKVVDIASARSLPPPVTVSAADTAQITIAQVLAEAAYSLVAKAQGKQDDVLELLRG